MGATEGRRGIRCYLPAIVNNNKKKKTKNNKNNNERVLKMTDSTIQREGGVIWDCDWSQLCWRQ